MFFRFTCLLLFAVFKWSFIKASHLPRSPNAFHYSDAHDGLRTHYLAFVSFPFEPQMATNCLVTIRVLTCIRHATRNPVGNAAHNIGWSVLTCGQQLSQKVKKKTSLQTVL